MLPAVIYERLPAGCLLAGALLLIHPGHQLSLLGGILLFAAGSLIWSMRSTRRRRDLVIYPSSKWLEPDWLYELRPFVLIAIALLCARQTGQRELLLLLSTLIGWELWCLLRQHLHRRTKPARF